jgi:hypothetical protein
LLSPHMFMARCDTWFRNLFTAVANKRGVWGVVVVMATRRVSGLHPSRQPPPILAPHTWMNLTACMSLAMTNDQVPHHLLPNKPTLSLMSCCTSFPSPARSTIAGLSSIFYRDLS